MDYFTQIQEATTYIRNCAAYPLETGIETGVILGSGLGALADAVENPTIVNTADIPHFARPSVHGHAGQLVLGQLRGRAVAFLKGRVHFYEGYTMHKVTFATRVFKALGATNLVVTNASGGLAPRLETGDLLLIADHIHQMPNPLIGPNDERLGPRFPRMAVAYDKEYLEVARQASKRLQIPLQEGVYLGVSGPSFETPAEIRHFTTIGADAVGMSTTPEVIVASHSSMRVLGISCVTNVLHAGPCHDTHTDVLDVANRVGPKFCLLLTEILGNLGKLASKEQIS